MACPCKNKKKRNPKSSVKAPNSTKVHHTKSSVKVTNPNLNRGRIQYNF